MPKKNKSTIHRHVGRIEDSKQIHINEIVNGMMVTFNYRSNTVNDRNPLVLCLDRTDNLLSGINFNYIPDEISIQNLFKKINRFTDIKLSDETNVGKKYTSVALRDKRVKGGVNPEVLYENVLKDGFLKRFNNCYRTYKTSKIGTLQAVNYKLDIMEKEIRKQTQLKSKDISKSDLHKAISEIDESIVIKKGT
jgi:hypothetical protein